MKTTGSLISAAIAVNLLLWSAGPAGAGTISFTGNLRTDATVTDCGTGCTLGSTSTDVQYAQFAAVVRPFNVTTAFAVKALTFSYGGGTNGAGAVIPQGGFEPYLSLFDGSGNFLASTFGTNCYAGAHTNTNSSQCFDVLLDGGTLAPGNYQIAISAFENLSSAENLGSGTLSDGFTGLGNLPVGEDLHYAFDVVLPPDSTTVPEPATLSLATLAAACLGLLRKKA